MLEICHWDGFLLFIFRHFYYALIKMTLLEDFSEHSFYQIYVALMIRKFTIFQQWEIRLFASIGWLKTLLNWKSERDWSKYIAWIYYGAPDLHASSLTTILTAGTLSFVKALLLKAWSKLLYNSSSALYSMATLTAKMLKIMGRRMWSQSQQILLCLSLGTIRSFIALKSTIHQTSQTCFTLNYISMMLPSPFISKTGTVELGPFIDQH